MFRVEQVFDHPRVADPAQAAKDALAGVVDARSLAGKSVAVTVGSRGIANLPRIVRGLVEQLRGWGGKPFIIPAMGSHGGGTAEGQVAVLATLGVTEESVGEPIRSSMETVEVGRTDDGFPVVIDKHAAQADAILILNRVKPHTEFFGPYQSGLLKMLLIGLGKHTGARNYHAAATQIPFERLIRTAAAVVIGKVPILAGIAIIENAFEQTAHIVGVRPREFLDVEEELLALAASYLPGIPYNNIDLLIVDEMGKNISGAGMDTNVIRRKHWSEPGRGETLEPTAPKRVFVRDLTEATQGNAAGIGLADFALKRLADKIDRHKTYINCITSTRPRGAMLPLLFDTDEEAIAEAVESASVQDSSQARIVRIRNTLHLLTMEVSQTLEGDLCPGARVRVIAKGRGLVFDRNGMLVPDKLPVGGD